MAADDLAFLAHRLHRRSDLHVPFRRLGSGDPALAAVAAAATESWTCPRARRWPRARAGPLILATSAPYPGGAPGAGARPAGPLRRAGRRPAGSPGARQLLHLGAARTLIGEMPWREDPGPLAGDRDRELEVGGGRAVLGEDRPAVAP